MSQAADPTVDVVDLMRGIGEAATRAAYTLAQASTEAKNAALLHAADALEAATDAILTANQQDMDAARTRGVKGAFLDRLQLSPKRIASMAGGLREIAALPDPVGTELARWSRPNGLDIARVRVPLGVIGVIYESRPNVTADAGALCLKAGNAAILRGGSESFHSSRAIHRALVAGLEAAGLPAEAIQLVPTRDRAAVGAMLRMSEHIDVIVPRGGKGLIQRVTDESRVPLFKHLEGICHTYIDAAADPRMALRVAYNAKMRRPGICGATETLLVHRDVAPTQLPKLLEKLRDGDCEIRGDDAVRALDPAVKPATDADWDTEYLDTILAVRIVDDLEQAIEHIITHGSQHTDAIITDDPVAAERFLNSVNSAIAMVNASTQFADGGEFGMGAEIGISTGKLHARGPVGVEQLTTMKYLVRGSGQTRPR